MIDLHFSEIVNNKKVNTSIISIVTIITKYSGLIRSISGLSVVSFCICSSVPLFAVSLKTGFEE